MTVTSETKEIANGITARVVRDTVTRGRRGRRGHLRLVRPGRRRQRLVPRRGHRRVRGRRGLPRGRARSRPASTAPCRGHHARPTPAVGMQYRQEYYEGEAEDNGEVLSTGRAGRGPGRPLRRRAPDQGHDHASSRTCWSTSSTPPASARCSRSGVSGGRRPRGAARGRPVGEAAARAAGTTPLGGRYP